MPRKLSAQMRTTLEALYGYEHGVDEGSTTGAIEASGGTRSALYAAVKKEWAAKCGNAWTQRFYNTEMGNVTRYTLTLAGKQALLDDGWVDPGTDSGRFVAGHKILHRESGLPAVVKNYDPSSLTLDVVYPDTGIEYTGAPEDFRECDEPEWWGLIEQELAKPGVQQIRKDLGLKGPVIA